MIAMEIAFWAFLIWTLYPYVFYPLVVAAWSRVAPNRWSTGEALPRISLIISVYNEEDVIREKVRNALRLDYPADRIEIIVASDGSSDNTNRYVRAFNDDRVVLKEYDRLGKTACLNLAVADASGDIVVFTDANAMFPPESMRTIVRHFGDAAIGLVTGWTRYQDADTGAEEAPGVYARLEKVTKHAESLIHSCVGAAGAIFALRKELFRPLDVADINDFVIPLQVIRQRGRVILDPELYCFEAPTQDLRKELRRQARMTNRTLRAIGRHADCLNPFRYGSFSFFLLSHKVLRFMVPFFAIGTAGAAFALFDAANLYATASVAIVAFAVLGAVGLIVPTRFRVIRICSTFLFTMIGQVFGWYRLAVGQTDAMWAPER